MNLESSRNDELGTSTTASPRGPRRPALLYVIAGYPSPSQNGIEPSGIGGCELQAQRVARLLAACFEMRVLTRRVGRHDSTGMLDSVQVDRIRLDCSGTVPATIDAGRIALAGIRVDRADIIQGFQLNGVTIGAAVLAGMQRVPLVIKITDRLNVRALLPSQVGRTKLRFLMHAASAIVAPSATCLKDLQALDLPGHKLSLIPNGVDTGLFRPPSPATRSTARRRLGFSDQDFVFAWVARLDSRKGFDHICRVWGRLIEARPRARLVVAGAGQENALAGTLSHEHRETVKWLGMVDDVQSVHAAADAIVVASSSEGLSNTLLEGMASGLPAVVSNIPENTEVDPDGSFVISFNRESPEGLLDALVEMIDRKSRADIESMRAGARERAVKDYSLRVTAENWAQLYLRLLSRSN